MNPHIDTPVFLFIRTDEVEAARLARELSGGSYCLTSRMFRGPGGAFRVGEHAGRCAVLQLSEERANDLLRHYLELQLHRHALLARNARHDARMAEGDEEAVAEAVATADHQERLARHCRERIAALTTEAA